MESTCMISWNERHPKSLVETKDIENVDKINQSKILVKVSTHGMVRRNGGKYLADIEWITINYWNLFWRVELNTISSRVKNLDIPKEKYYDTLRYRNSGLIFCYCRYENERVKFQSFSRNKNRLIYTSK